ncbi:MAG: hypothetical protein V1747_10960 [Candidatus Omnitrophota bacterium]
MITIIIILLTSIIGIIFILKLKSQNNSIVDYDLEKIKDLKLEDEIMVDIGYLANEEHENAFIDIFETVFLSNKSTLEKYENIEIQNERINITLFYKSLRKYAKKLYNLGIDSIDLSLKNDDTKAKIKVMFDNPSFYLEI